MVCGSGFPAVAVGGAGGEFVGGFDVGDFHGGFVPLDGLLGADGEISEEDEFGEGGGVVEIGGGEAAIDDVVGPFALGIVWHDGAGLGLLDLAGLHVFADGLVFFEGVDDGALAVGIAFEDDAVGADEHHAAGGFFEGVFGDVGVALGLVGDAVDFAIMPGDGEGGVFAGGHVVNELGPHGGVEVGDGAGFGFDLFRDELAEDGEGGIHDVAAHVAEGAGAELPPAAPVEGGGAGGALLLFGHFGVEIELEVGLGGFAGEPEVPVEVGGAFDELLLDGALRPDGAVGPEADFFEGADGTLLDPFFGHALSVHGAALIAHLGDDFGVFGGAVEVADFGDVVAEGLLDADVLAVLDGVHGGEVVGVVRGGDDDPVDLVRHFIEHLAEVLVELGGGGRGLGGVEVVLFALFGGFIEALGVDIDHGDDVVIEGDHAGVCETFAVGADLDEVEALGGGILAAEEEIRPGEGAGGEAGGGGEEVAA